MKDPCNGYCSGIVMFSTYGIWLLCCTFLHTYCQCTTWLYAGRTS